MRAWVVSFWLLLHLQRDLRGVDSGTKVRLSTYIFKAATERKKREFGSSLSLL